MSTELKLRRGTALQHTAFTGSNGEVTVNTTNKTLHVHDGVTMGGFEVLRKSLLGEEINNILQGVDTNDVSESTITVLQNFTSPENFGAVSVESVGDLIDATSAIQAAIDTGIPVLLSGLYLVNPAVGLIVKNGTRIKGRNLETCGLLAMYNVAGSVIKRTFTAGVVNPRVDEPVLEDFSIFLNHIHQNTLPANIQIAFNMSNISRSKVYRCYGGNYRWGVAATRFPNAGTKSQAMRGYGFVYGNVSAGDIAYCGGEVHTNVDCKSWWVNKAFGIDLFELTAGASAAYNIKIYRPDIQTCEVGISQESQYNTGCSFIDPLIQDLRQAAGSSNNVYGVLIEGYQNKLTGGYFESVDASISNIVRLGVNSKNNVIDLPYNSNVDEKKFSDVGVSNEINGFFFNGSRFRFINNFNKEEVGEVTFDSSGVPISGYGYAGVSQNATGDFNINWSTGVTNDNSVIEAQCYSNVSGIPISCNVRGHSGTTSRVISYNVFTNSVDAVLVNATKYIVKAYRHTLV